MNKYKDLKISNKDLIKLAKFVISEVMVKYRKKCHPINSNRMWGYFETRLPNNAIATIGWLKTIGCSHTLSGGCSMCAYSVRKNGQKLENKKMSKAIDDLLSYLEFKNKGQKQGTFNISTGGSFFDDQELSENFRMKIYKRIAKNRKKHRNILFRTETRLEFISEEKLREMRKILKNNVEIIIGFGIESTNLLIREACINKNLPVNYINKIKLLKKFNVKTNVPIILKPPFLSEKEAINDAVKSVKDILKAGTADYANVMTMNSRPGTLVRLLEEEGRYQLPKIWSTIEVIKLLGFNIVKKMSFPGFSVGAGKKQIRTVKGCKECNKVIMPIILQFNKPTKDRWNYLLKASRNINCSCEKEWIKLINKKEKYNLRKRIFLELDYISTKFLGIRANDVLSNLK